MKQLATKTGLLHRYLALLVVMLSLFLTTGSALAEEPPHHPVNFTLYYPVGTNQNADISTNFRLSLIYGRVGEVRGLDINTGVSVVQRDFRGVQGTLLYSQVYGSFGGLAMTGLVNNFQTDMSGVQISGLVNVTRGHMTGFQYASLFNYVEGGLSGAQLSSVFNSNQGEGGFLQLASVANINEGDFNGAQIGGVNLTSGWITGFQLGLANTAFRVHGVQAGIVNMTKEARGVQIGALNLAAQNEGMPLGLVNIDEASGDVDWIVAGSNLAMVSTGVRTTVNRWYSVLSVGYGDQQGDVEESAFLAWNYGRVFPLGRTWNLDIDLGFVHIIPEHQDDPELNDRLHFAVQARALAEVQLGKTVAVFAGGGVSSIYSEYSSSAKQETEPHVVLGVSLF